MPKAINEIRRCKLKKAVMQGKSYRQALKEAGYSRATYHSHIADSKVLKSVKEEIKAEMRLSELTADKLLNDFELAKTLSLKEKDYSNYNRACEAEARMGGYFKDKSEITTKQDVNPNDLTPDKIRETLREALKDDMQGV